MVSPAVRPSWSAWPFSEPSHFGLRNSDGGLGDGTEAIQPEHWAELAGCWNLASAGAVRCRVFGAGAHRRHLQRRGRFLVEMAWETGHAAAKDAGKVESSELVSAQCGKLRPSSTGERGICNQPQCRRLDGCAVRWNRCFGKISSVVGAGDDCLDCLLLEVVLCFIWEICFNFFELLNGQVAFRHVRFLSSLQQSKQAG